jgi:hypothetical protein
MGVDFNEILKTLHKGEKVIVMSIPREAGIDVIVTYHTIKIKNGKPIEVFKCFGGAIEVRFCIN